MFLLYEPIIGFYKNDYKIIREIFNKKKYDQYGKFQENKEKLVKLSFFHLAAKPNMIFDKYNIPQSGAFLLNKTVKDSYANLRAQDYFRKFDFKWFNKYNNLPYESRKKLHKRLNEITNSLKEYLENFNKDEFEFKITSTNIEIEDYELKNIFNSVNFLLVAIRETEKIHDETMDAVLNNELSDTAAEATEIFCYLEILQLYTKVYYAMLFYIHILEMLKEEEAFDDFYKEKEDFREFMDKFEIANEQIILLYNKDQNRRKIREDKKVKVE